MSKSKPGPSHHPANSPQASSQALLDELRLAADRARMIEGAVLRARLQVGELGQRTPSVGVGLPATAPRTKHDERDDEHEDEGDQDRKERVHDVAFRRRRA